MWEMESITGWMTDSCAIDLVVRHTSPTFGLDGVWRYIPPVADLKTTRGERFLFFFSGTLIKWKQSLVERQGTCWLVGLFVCCCFGGLRIPRSNSLEEWIMTNSLSLTGWHGLLTSKLIADSFSLETDRPVTGFIRLVEAQPFLFLHVISFSRGDNPFW